jgi:ribose transport system permease protein
MTAPLATKDERDAKRAASLRDRFSRVEQAYLVLIITGVLVIVAAVLNDRFLTIENFSNLLRMSSAFAVLAVGQAIVVMGKGIDLSSAAVAVALSQTYLSFITAGMPEMQAIVLVVVFAAVIGVLNGILVAYVQVPALFTTLGVGLLTVGIANTFMIKENFYRVPADSVLRSLTYGTWFGVPRAIVIAVVVFLLAGAFIALTSRGKLIRAIGDNISTARETGAPVRTLQVLSYVISSLLALLAGLVYVSLSGNSQTVHTSFHALLFTALTITVIGGVSLSGGRGSILGIFVGTIFVGVLNNLLLLQGLSSAVQDIIRSAVLLGAIALDAWLHPRDEETAKSGEL